MIFFNLWLLFCFLYIKHVKVSFDFLRDDFGCMKEGEKGSKNLMTFIYINWMDKKNFLTPSTWYFYIIYFQEEAVNLNVISTTGTRRSLRVSNSPPLRVSSPQGVNDTPPLRVSSPQGVNDTPPLRVDDSTPLRIIDFLPQAQCRNVVIALNVDTSDSVI